MIKLIEDHIYIECDTIDQWRNEQTKYDHYRGSVSYNCEVPNSLGGAPHPQFTITIAGKKVTIWYNVENLS